MRAVDGFQSPRGDFGFLKFYFIQGVKYVSDGICFQSPRGDFGFLKPEWAEMGWNVNSQLLDFQSPRGDFGFLKVMKRKQHDYAHTLVLSIPSRGFWFFEVVKTSSISRMPPQLSIPSRGFWFFEAWPPDAAYVQRPMRLSIPSRGFWFFEVLLSDVRRKRLLVLSIPSRGFWFFEVDCRCFDGVCRAGNFQSPRGDFGFLKTSTTTTTSARESRDFQSPRGDFGFLKDGWKILFRNVEITVFQSPRGDFGFLKLQDTLIMATD